MASELVISDKSKLLELMSDTELSNIKLLEFLQYSKDDIKKEQKRRYIINIYNTSKSLDEFMEKTLDELKKNKLKIDELSAQITACFVNNNELEETIKLIESIKTSNYETSEGSDENKSSASNYETYESTENVSSEINQVALNVTVIEQPPVEHTSIQSRLGSKINRPMTPPIVSNAFGNSFLPLDTSLDNITRKRYHEEPLNLESKKKTISQVVAYLSQNLMERENGELQFSPIVEEYAPYQIYYEVCTNDSSLCNCGKYHSRLRFTYGGNKLPYALCGYDRPWLLKTNGEPAYCTITGCKRLHLKK